MPELTLENANNPNSVTSQIFNHVRSKVESATPAKAEPEKKTSKQVVQRPEFKPDPEVPLPNEAWTLEKAFQDKPAPKEEEAEEEVEKEEETEGEEAEEGEEEAEGEEAADASEVPTYNLETDDGEEIKVSGNTTVILNGKKVPFSEAMKKIEAGFEIESAKLEAETITQEAHKKREAIESKLNELQQVDQMVAAALRKVQGGAGLEAFHEIIEIAGGFETPIDWEISILETVAPMLQSLMNMDQEQRNNWLTKRKADYILDRDKRRKEQAKETPDQAARRTEVEAVKKQYGVSDEEWNEAVHILTAIKKKGELAKYGYENITPAAVAELARTQSAAKSVDGRLVKQFPELRKKIGDERYADIRKTLVRTVSKLDLDAEEIDSIIRDASAEALKGEEDKEDERVLTRKSSALSQGRKASKANGAAKKTQGHKVVTFADARKFVNDNFPGR